MFNQTSLLIGTAMSQGIRSINGDAFLDIFPDGMTFDPSDFQMMDMHEMPLINIEFNGPIKVEIYPMLGPHPILPMIMDVGPWDMMMDMVMDNPFQDPYQDLSNNWDEYQKTTPFPNDEYSSTPAPTNWSNDSTYPVYNDTATTYDWDLDHQTTTPKPYTDWIMTTPEPYNNDGSMYHTSMAYDDDWNDGTYNNNTMPYYNEWDSTTTSSPYYGNENDLDMHQTITNYDDDEWYFNNGDDAILSDMYDDTVPYDKWDQDSIHYNDIMPWEMDMTHDDDILDQILSTSSPSDSWNPYEEWGVENPYEAWDYALDNKRYLMMESERNPFLMGPMTERFLVDEKTLAYHQYGIWHDKYHNECSEAPCDHYHPFGIWFDVDGNECDPINERLCIRFVPLIQLQTWPEGNHDIEGDRDNVKKSKRFMGRRLTISKIYTGPVLVNPYAGGYPGFGSFHNTYRSPGYGYGGYGGGFNYGGRYMGFGPSVFW